MRVFDFYLSDRISVGPTCRLAVNRSNFDLKTHCFFKFSARFFDLEIRFDHFFAISNLYRLGQIDVCRPTLIAGNTFCDVCVEYADATIE